MLNSYRAVIEKGQIKWLDKLPTATSLQMIVTVLSPVENEIVISTQTVKQKRKLGFMQSEMTVPDDIHWGDKQVQDLFSVI